MGRDEKLMEIRELADELSRLSGDYEERSDEVAADPEWRMAYSLISHSLGSVAEKVDALAGSASLA